MRGKVGVTVRKVGPVVDEGGCRGSHLESDGVGVVVLVVLVVRREVGAEYR